MSGPYNFPEILAPVGNIDMLYAAVRSGADAVYLGAEDFNARRNATNFREEALKEAVSYCHIRGVKVYLTLNILISDAEFQRAVDLCFKAYNAGVDAVIIADTGLSLYISKALPELNLHASTQMTVYSPEALEVLKKMGFKRVVAARELSKDALKVLTSRAKELDIEIEVFIHGALCMCVSGQCLMSAFLGGRSGNRGLCAGPCRLPFSADESKERYDLSLKDLSLLEHLKELKQIGVASFKIEGRMKRPEYVAAAVLAARYSRENGSIPEDISILLKGVFSRSGFTDGYYVNQTGKDMFGTRSKDDVLSAPTVMPKLHELYRKEFSHIPLSAELDLSDNSGSLLTLCDCKNTVTINGEKPQPALNKPMDKDAAFKMLSKLGNTPYYLESFSFSSKEGVTLPSSVLNSMRRAAVEELNKLRSTTPTPKNSPVLKPKTPCAKKIKGFILRLEDISLLPDDITDVAALLIPAEKLTEKIDINIPVIAELPRVCEDSDLLFNILKKLKANGINYASCGNLSQLLLIEKAELQCLFGFGMNVFSSFSCDFAKENGAKGIVLSPEMTLRQIKNISCDIPTSVIAYGHLPLMIFKNCPVSNVKRCKDCGKNGTLIDRKNTKFKVRCRGNYSELFNSTPIWLADCLEQVACDYAILYFSDESKEKTSRILNAFRSKERSMQGFTRGLYTKGVL